MLACADFFPEDPAGAVSKRVESRHCEGAARSNPVINIIPDCFASLAMTTRETFGQPLPAAPGDLHIRYETLPAAPGDLHIRYETLPDAPGDLHIRYVTSPPASGDLHIRYETSPLASGDLHIRYETLPLASGDLHIRYETLPSLRETPKVSNTDNPEQAERSSG
jgi:hypothetical protein